MANLTMKMPASTRRAVRVAERKGVGGLKDAQERYADAVSEFPDFARETFGRLLAPANNRALPASQVNRWAAGAHRILDRQDSFGELQVASRAHREIAAESAADLSLAVGAMMGLGKMKKDEATTNPEAIRSTQEALREEGSDEAAAAADAMESAHRRAQARREHASENLSDEADKGLLRTAMEGIVDRAKRKAKAVSLMRGCGLGGPNGETAGAIPDDLVAAVGDDPLFALIMDALGRMQEASDSLRQSQTRTGHLDVIGVVPGDDPSRLISSELAKLADDDMADDLLRRLVQRETLCWELAGEDDADKGEVVVLMDRSGSMGQYRMAWARALAVAAVVRAHGEGRRATLVAFDHRCESCTVEPNGEGLEAVLRLARAEARGGTDIAKAIARAVEVAATMEEADVLIVTDGAFGENDAQAAVAACGLGAAFVGVFIGSGGGQTGWLDRKYRLNPSAETAGDDAQAAATVLEELA